MPTQSTSPARVVDDARRILQTIHDEIAGGRQPYTSDVRRLVERSLALRFAEYVQFMERYGFLSLERRTDSLKVTTAGRQVIEGSAARLKSMAGDAKYHFGDRLNDAPMAEVEAVAAERFDVRYLKYECIGQGGLGSVWRGHHNTLDRPVALKLLSGLDEMFRPEQKEEARRRFELTVREHARLNSPFIATIFDQNAQHDPPYVVLELATGGNLRALLDQGRLDPSVALRYFIQMALGLRAAHAHGILHRDLKPSNVLLDAAGNVKIVDFGLTRVAERSNTMRQAYVGYGSVGYMAPEMFRRTGTSNPTIDVYALGILLYEMLTGELPGRRSPMPSAISEGVPTDLDELFDIMTQDQARRRPADMDAVLAAVWASDDIVALLDAKQAPLFVDAPTALPGLPTPVRDPLAAMLAEKSDVSSPTNVEAAPAPAVPASAPPQPVSAPAVEAEDPEASLEAAPHHEEPTPAVVSMPPEPADDEVDEGEATMGIRAQSLTDEDAPEVVMHVPDSVELSGPPMAQPIGRPGDSLESTGTQELNISDLVESADLKPEASADGDRPSAPRGRAAAAPIKSKFADRIARLKTSK